MPHRRDEVELSESYVAESYPLPKRPGHVDSDVAVWIKTKMNHFAVNVVEKRNILHNKSSVAESYPLLKRPGHVVSGVAVWIKTNHFAVNVVEKRNILHYKVSISPKLADKNQRMQLFSDLVRLRGISENTLIYDGGDNCYTTSPLNGVYCLPPHNRVVTFILVSTFEIHSDHKAVNKLIKGSFSKRYSVIGNNFSPHDFRPFFHLGGGVKYTHAFHRGLRRTQTGLYLNLDTSTTPLFQPIPVDQFTRAFLQRDGLKLKCNDLDLLTKILKGVVVETRHTACMNARHKIVELTRQSLDNLMFSWDGVEISVAYYFMKKYGYQLRSPQLPALQVGTDAKPVYIPMELCHIIPRQIFPHEYLKKPQAINILAATHQLPEVKELSILSMHCHEQALILRSFGIEIKKEMTLLKSRVLRSPMLKYHCTNDEDEDGVVVPIEGVWYMKKNHKMMGGGKVESWACINFSKLNNSVVENFCSDLIDTCINKGMEFSPEPATRTRHAVPCAVRKALIDIKGECGQHLNLLIVILHERKDLYGKIKRVCETELGIVSQCFRPESIQKSSRQYKQCLQNVSMKINAKVGGQNCALTVPVSKKMPEPCDEPTIVFGADVSHPPPGDDSSPSIAGVVASMDWPEITKYRGLVSAQTPRKEIIQDLYSSEEGEEGGMIREHLLSFKKFNGKLPQRILFYRDGVGEGQFKHVLVDEVDAIRKACKSIEKDYMPKITFVVVQKRHHTRFFAFSHDDQSMLDSSGNIVAGTVVDTKICHPNDFDFYLCSHAGVKGTSRPAHYHVLVDENKFDAGDLHSLTYHLCYTYARCTRSVSIVPPAYYAHLIARRGRFYIEDVEMTRTQSVCRCRRRSRKDCPCSWMCDDGGRMKEMLSMPKIMDNVKDVMFYI